ncbi:hypothetical protein H2198_000236 [Neophaeococcomyces mojaviensis]|uniref:Uncharacterized protein n=1 Tax=Neophaeococcomyces mojaviensis TaxID=3383035 RepID=A0ACC3ALE6_9EURO|nr:hypothetical protein H2198_000236 [Knufia sp. JES_112]
MADDDGILTSQILLRHATSRSKAKSWLAASLGAEEGINLSSAASSALKPDEDLALLQGDDENAGVGVVKKAGESDDLSHRQLLSANEALRKRLLSKDAYKKYTQESKNGMHAPKPMPSKVTKNMEDDDGEEESKGRPNRASRASQKKVVSDERGTVETTENATTSTASNINPPFKGKKRPGSYLDQVLAEREKKSRRKANAKAENA